MKAKAIVSAAMMSMVGMVSPALAAGAREDHSGIVVWVFLGFCALIVIAQLVPAVLLMTGLIKGVAAPREAAEQKAAE